MRYQGPEQRSRRVPQLTAESNTVRDDSRVKTNNTTLRATRRSDSRLACTAPFVAPHGRTPHVVEFVAASGDTQGPSGVKQIDHHPVELVQ